MVFNIRNASNDTIATVLIVYPILENKPMEILHAVCKKELQILV